MEPEEAYETLIRLSREETVLSSCSDFLEWDEEVSMPPKGEKHRAEQMALLAGILHDRSTDPRYDELLGTIENSSLVSDPESPEAVNVRELRRGYEKECRIPRRLVEETARVTAHASREWTRAWKKNDYKSAGPLLDRVFALARETADAVGHEGDRYDALLDDYEPGITSVRLDHLFGELANRLTPLIESRREQSPRLLLTGKRFAVDRQKSFSEHVARSLSFDFESGRIDTGQHAFCMEIGPEDVRIATRFQAGDLTSGIFTLLHEVGHGLYDQGLEPAHYGTPMGEAASLGLHESQSRLWENFVGRSKGFWIHFYPQLQDVFKTSLQDISLEAFHSHVNRVEPGLNRVDADEVTYNIHILIRFELERALLSGDLKAIDLPGAWAEFYQRYLGITPSDDRSGCLQDSHWAEGLIGYFPTYALGNVYAAQIFDAAERSLGSIADGFAAGDFSGLRKWLGENIHRHGMRYRSSELLTRLGGNAADPSSLIRHLSS